MKSHLIPESVASHRLKTTDLESVKIEDSGYFCAGVYIVDQMRWEGPPYLWAVPWMAGVPDYIKNKVN